MPIAIQGSDGNTLGSRDIDGSADNFILVAGRMAFSGSYTSGGDTLDWTTVAGAGISSSICVQVFIETANGSNVLYSPIGGPATALNAWKVKVFNGSFTELGAGAYPAAVTGDTIAFQAMFRKLL